MLKVDGLSAHYGAIHAVKNVSLEVREGEIVTIVGPNGAGKTTLLRTVSGLHRASAGTIAYREQRHRQSGTSSHRPHRADAGSPGPASLRRHDRSSESQDGRLSPCRPLGTGAQARPRRGLCLLPPAPGARTAKGRHAERRRAGHAGDRARLDVEAASPVARRALLRLAPKMVDAVFDALLALNRAGRTVVLVEQNAELAFEVAQRGYLMVLGPHRVDGFDHGAARLGRGNRPLSRPCRVR